MIRVTGVDPSLSNTGLAQFRGPDPIWNPDASETPQLGFVTTPNPQTKGAPRDPELDADRILDAAQGTYSWIMARHDPGDDHWAIIEGPSMHSVHGLPDERAGLRWQIACALRRTGIRVVLVPPATVKMYWVKKGNAKKSAMLGWARQRYTLPGGIRDDNQADALALAHMGATRRGIIGLTVPTVLLPELEKVRWPR